MSSITCICYYDTVSSELGCALAGKRMLDGKVVELDGKDLEVVAPEVRCAAACWQLTFFGHLQNVL